MNKNVSVSTENQKFINAFIKVANILEPSIEFTDVLYNKVKKGDETDVAIVVSGFTSPTPSPIRVLVQVTKELRDPMKGMEIVVRYINPITAKVIKERGVWYFSFNWKGLMNTCGENE